jgi:hypothetical protein
MFVKAAGLLEAAGKFLEALQALDQYVAEAQKKDHRGGGRGQRRPRAGTGSREGGPGPAE